jgi:hypothetical protein
MQITDRIAGMVMHMQRPVGAKSRLGLVGIRWNAVIAGDLTVEIPAPKGGWKAEPTAR